MASIPNDFDWGKTPVLFVGGVFDGFVYAVTAPFVETPFSDYQLMRTAEGWRMVCVNPAVTAAEKAWEATRQGYFAAAMREAKRIRERD